MKYDINLKKTQLGYQFDRNVFIGYQTNDNRVVTVKELKGYIGGSGGGGGGGGGGIQSITLSSDPSSGQITLTVDGAATTVAATNVVAAAPSTIPSTAKVCVITQSDNEFVVYPTDTTWVGLLASIPSILWNSGGDANVLQITVGGATHTLALGSGLSKSVSGLTTTLSIDNGVVRGLSITNNGLNYTDGSGTHGLGGVIGTTPVTTLSIATKTSTAPSDDAIVTVGYLNTQYQGGNVYYTENDPTADPPSDMDQTKFIFVEVE